jgi:hypothetical protein
MVDPDEILMGDPGNAEDEESEDYLDYNAAGEAIDEALGKGDVAHLEQFIKELGLENDGGL